MSEKESIWRRNVTATAANKNKRLLVQCVSSVAVVQHGRLTDP
jgi:hypothetical protein